MDARPGKAKTSRLTQLKAREERGESPPELELPEIPEAVEHVVEYLFEVGPIVGDHAVTFSEISAWRQETGVSLNEFEATTLRILSQAYVGMLHEASDAKCPPPLMRSNALPSKEDVSNKLRDFLRSMNSSKAKAERIKRQRERKGVDE